MVNIEVTNDGAAITIVEPIEGSVLRLNRHGRRVLFTVVDTDSESVVLDLSVQAARDLIGALARWDSNVLTGDEEG